MILYTFSCFLIDIHMIHIANHALYRCPSMYRRILCKYKVIVVCRLLYRVISNRSGKLKKNKGNTEIGGAVVNLKLCYGRSACKIFVFSIFFLLSD